MYLWVMNGQCLKEWKIGYILAPSLIFCLILNNLSCESDFCALFSGSKILTK